MANEQSQSLTRLTFHVCGGQNVLYVRLCDVNVLRSIVHYARLAYTMHSHRSTTYVLVKVRFLQIGWHCTIGRNKRQMRVKTMQTINMFNFTYSYNVRLADHLFVFGIHNNTFACDALAPTSNVPPDSVAFLLLWLGMQLLHSQYIFRGQWNCTLREFRKREKRE